MFPLKENRIRLGGWWSTDPKLISDDYVRLIAESGCDFIMTSQLGNTEKIRELLSYCDKYGVECIVYDTRIYDNEDIDIGALTREYSAFPSFVGNMIKDEPGVEELPHIRRLYDKFRAQTPGKDAYINLLPMYASAAQLKYGAGVQSIDYYDTPNTTYGEHLDAYCRMFDTPYICVDVYPCRTAPDGITRTIYPGYLENLSQIAHFCRKYDRQLWIMVQSLVWYAGATPPDETDLRWQFYTVMAFGAQAIFHYCLATPPGHTPGLLTDEGKKSDLYYPAQRFHRYLKSIEDIYLSYRNIGAFSVNSTPETPYLEFAEQLTDFAPLAALQTEDQLLAGCFEAREGSGWAMVLVNMTPLSQRKTAHARLKLNARRVTAYADGMAYSLAADEEGFIDISLPCGEGIYLTIE